MKRFITFLLILFCFQSYGQVGAVVVVKNPAWVAADNAREANEIKDRVALYAQTTQLVVNAKEQLQWVRDATNKLKQINRKIANFRYLEESISAVSSSYSRVQKTLGTLNEHNCFSPTEYRSINQSLISMVGQTSIVIQSLTVVLTDNFSEMNDGDRLMNLNNSLKQLREDLYVVDAFLNELEILDNQRLQIRTMKYLETVFK